MQEKLEKYIFIIEVDIWHLCLLMDPKTSCLLMDPENHEGSIKRHEVLGPSKDMRF